MFQTIQRQISGVNSELNYRLSLVKHTRNLPPLSPGDRQIVNALKQSGAYVTSLTELGLASTTQMLNTAESFLPTMVNPRDCHGGYKLPQIYTVTDLPEFFNWGMEARLQNIMENYIGLPIAFQGVHLRKDFPNHQQLQTLLWHKDSEDRRLIKVIIYLHDVTAEHGPFEYVPFDYSWLAKLSSYQIDYELLQTGYLGITDEKLSRFIPQSAWKSCPGKTGTVIFVDPRKVIHHGTIRTQERSTLFFVYTAKQPKRPELCTQYNDTTFVKPKKAVNC
jgi:hypothetical protein